MEDLFAVALKPKMTWLDHSGMDRADCDLVDFLTFDTIEVGNADEWLLA